MTWSLLHADCRTVMANMGDDTIDAVVCDPPYHLSSIVKRFGSATAAPAQVGASRGFMGKEWDGGDIAFDPTLWAEVLRVLKPGGYLIAFSGTRTYHRMACAIEDAGFEIRDMLEWLYGSGFPKGGLDDQGRGVALKPAHEPACMARKPFRGSVAQCLETWGTGALNIDAGRVPTVDGYADNRVTQGGDHFSIGSTNKTRGTTFEPAAGGRFPANVAHDGSPEVLAAFPQAPGQQGLAKNDGSPQGNRVYGALKHGTQQPEPRGDTGSAARFFYCAKASKRDRDEGCDELEARTVLARYGEQGQGPLPQQTPRVASEQRNTHPTVKPTALMQWLIRLACPPGGLVFDPFTGSGSTGKAALLEGRRFLGAEMTAEYIPIARARLQHALLTAGSIKSYGNEP